MATREVGNIVERGVARRCDVAKERDSRSLVMVGNVEKEGWW